MNKLSIDDLNLRGKRVLMRVDFNVPLKDGVVTDDTRIQAALPSIKKVVKEGGRLVLMSHLGRPKGQRNEKMSLKPAAARLTELLQQEVKLAPDCVGEPTTKLVHALHDGQVLLLENLRFHAAEEANDADFARALAAFGDVYINDAFGTAHRAHASTEGVTRFIKQSAAGYLMAAELKALGRLLENPAQPFVAVLGGAKISGKIDVIQNLLPRVDALLIGGGMVYTFLKARDITIGKSLLEEDKISVANDVLSSVAQSQRKVRLELPDDHLIADSIEAASATTTEGVAIPPQKIGVDIGPKTSERYAKTIAAARTIFWNGPMGVFENPAFAGGTTAVAKAVAKATQQGAFSVVGGGDSVSAITHAGLASQISHVSTGGGASLEFMAGEQLPGVVALSPAK